MGQARFQILSSNHELFRYQRETAERVDVELPMDYLQRARVIGLVDNHSHEILGGFTFAYQGPLRCLSQIPDEEQLQNSLIQKYKESCFEINGLWLDHSRAPNGSSFQLYLRCMEEAIRLSFKGKPKYVYAYSADNEKLRRFYRNFNSKKVYEGPIQMMPGMRKLENEVVEMGCMKRLPITVLRNPGFLLTRGFSSSRRRLSWI